MLDERAAGDPLEGARIMVSGRAEEPGADDLGVVRRRYLSVHPSAQTFVEFKDFFVCRDPSDARPIWSRASAGSSI